MLTDLRYAFRQLRKAPGFTITALATIAICLGANLAIFAVVNTVLLRPLPFPHSDRLVSIYNTYPKAAVENDGSSLTNYYERRGHLPAFSSLSIYRVGSEVVGDTGSTEQEEVMRISPDFFTTLGVGPAIGRSFDESETITPVKNHGVVILTDTYWRERLNCDPNVLGQDLRINGVARKIVGILPRDFHFLSSEAQIFLPLTSRLSERGPSERHSGGGATHMIARLRPGATIAEAQSQIDAHNASVERDDPQAKLTAEVGFRSMVLSLHADHVRSIRPTLLLMQGGVFFLLLIGAVNLVNLLLIRASGRAKEMAIRQSIGAGRMHVVKQVMVETLLLTVIGGLLGLGAGAWGIRLLEVLGTDRLPLGAHITFDGGLAIFGLLGAILLGIAIGLPVAWFNLSSHLANALQSESRAGTISRAAQRLRHGFIVAQIALAFVLLAGAALLGLSLKKVMAVSPGFRPDHVLTGQFTLPYSRYSEQTGERVAVVNRLVEAIDQQPGVVAAGTITNVPLSGDDGKTAVTPVEYVRRPGESPHGVYSYGVTGDYFSALDIPLHTGRFLTAADSQRSERICVIDEDFARRYWPNGGALGHRVFQGKDSDEANQFAIVGVVGAVKQAGLTQPPGQGAVYLPFSYRDAANIFVVTRTSQRPGAFAATLRKLVRATDPNLAIADVQSMEMRIDDNLVARRSPALLAGVFAAVALLLAAIGTYGVLSYAVAQRRREIGIRMALGAQKQQIGAQFLSLGLRLLAAGTALGLLGAWFVGRAMQSVLFDIPALPIAALFGTAVVMTTVSLIACLIPTRRASRVDPMEALRSE
ncbi:MAG TPA: ABC transporter permease [Chthoniobacterales bacterium]|jgi:predicted permease|nr:ABC transporter permease [Chthoniobacterales bacterium]